MCPFGISPMIFTILLCLCSINPLFHLAYRLDAMGSVDPKLQNIKPIINAVRHYEKKEILISEVVLAACSYNKARDNYSTL